MIEHALKLAGQGFELLPLHRVRPAPGAFQTALRTADPTVEHDATARAKIWRDAAARAVCSCRKGDCRSPGKHPRVAGGWKAATSDEETVKQWWTQWPDANIGIRVPQGMIVLDFDWKDPGALGAYRKLEPLLPDKTRRAQSGHGLHIWLEADPADVPRSKFAGGDIIHHDYRFVVAPPSEHWSGERYTWTDISAVAKATPALLAAVRGEGSSVASAPLLDADDPRLSEWRPKRRPPWMSPSEYAKEICLNAPPARDAHGPEPGYEHGSQTVQRVAAWLITGLELPPERAHAMMAELYAPRCIGPFAPDDPEFERLVTTAGRDGDPGYLQPTEASTRDWKARARADRDTARAALTKAKRHHAAMSSGDSEAELQLARRTFEAADERLAEATAAESRIRAGNVSEVRALLAGEDLDLQVNDKGRPINNAVNLERILRHLGEGVFRYNQLTTNLEVSKPVEMLPKGPWFDVYAFRLKTWLGATFFIEPSTSAIEEAVASLARKHEYHPIAEWLETLTWDGTTRLPNLLSRYFGAADTHYHRTIGPKWLVSAVARAFEPGCQVDTTLVLEGAQGVGKSTAIAALAGPEYFANSTIDLRNQTEGSKQLQGSWLYEIAELDGFRRADFRAVKSFVSRQWDNYRPSYGRHVQRYPRTCVFVGTTNESQYLIDPTGNRRFWPVLCGETIDRAGLASDREQLWAEAVQRYINHKAAQREPREWTPCAWWLSPEETALVLPEQAARQEDGDPWEELVDSWLQTQGETPFTALDALQGAIHLVPSQITHPATCRMGVVLTHHPRITKRKIKGKMRYAAVPEERVQKT